MAPATFLAVASTVIALAVARRPPRRRVGGLTGAKDRVFRSVHPHEALLASAVRELQLDVDPRAALAVLRWTAALAVVAALLVGGLAPAALAGAAALAAPRVTRRVLTIRATTRRDEQLAPMLDRMAADLRAGSALGPAFVTVAHTTAAPLGDDLRLVAAEVEHGAALSQALNRWGSRVAAGSPVGLAAASLALAAEAGGEVARAVDRVASTVRERRDLRAEVRALATQARASAAVLVAAPLGVAALVAGVEPTAITFLVTSPAGLLCLSAGLGLDALGAAWMARILREAP